jgi:glycosyltransferase involved in cell wall biosynthesis
MRILHLAYEDPRQPGSGGGSIRTREVNRRLARRHEITAVVAGYPGAASRVEDGVSWVPIGPRSPGAAPRLSYFALLSTALHRHESDLVVEDFAAPFSVGLSPLLTRRPVVASVQWLFAREMRAKYHLPFDLIEAAGIKAYDDFIVVSDWLGREVRRRRRRAIVETIPNGVDPMAFETRVVTPSHLAYVGRLDMGQKGLDILVEIVVRLRALVGDRMPPVEIIGDGPDRVRIEALSRASGIDDIVRFRGRLAGKEKFDAIGAAYAVLMPSRFETFGMVAVEALAAGVPLVAFDVGPLGEVAGAGGARLVAPFKADVFAREVARIIDDPAYRTHLCSTGRQWARQFDWDVIADRQEAHYVAALERHVHKRPRRFDGRR